jgi:hypothetical protein
MAMGAVRETRRTTRRRDPAGRSRREFRDVRHPLRPDLRVERVLVCPSGIHVVTALAADDPAATDPPADEQATARAHAAADVVAALLPQRYRARVRPVLCRVDDVAMAELVDDVLVTSASTLEHIVASSPVVLSTSEVDDVARRLDARLEPYPVVHVQKRPRRRRAHSVLAVGLAAASAAAVVVAHGAGVLPLPW